MKKYILTIMLALGMIINVSAQGDGFFTSNYNSFENRVDATTPGMPLAGTNIDYSADPNETPLGSGILLLAGMAFAYGLRKKNRD